MRITAQLIDAKTGKHLWSQRWDRPDKDLFAIQTEIAEQIATVSAAAQVWSRRPGRSPPTESRRRISMPTNSYLLGTEKLEQVNRRMSRKPSGCSPARSSWTPALPAPGSSFTIPMVCWPVSELNPTKTGPSLPGRRARRPARPERCRGARRLWHELLVTEATFERAKAEFDAALRLAPGQFEVLTFYIGWASTFGEPERGAELVERVIQPRSKLLPVGHRPFLLRLLHGRPL